MHRRNVPRLLVVCRRDLSRGSTAPRGDALATSEQVVKDAGVCPPDPLRAVIKKKGAFAAQVGAPETSVLSLTPTRITATECGVVLGSDQTTNASLKSPVDTFV